MTSLHSLPIRPLTAAAMLLSLVTGLAQAQTFDPSGTWVKGPPNQPNFTQNPLLVFDFKKTEQGIEMSRADGVAKYAAVPNEANTYSGISLTINGETITPPDIEQWRIIVTSKDTMTQVASGNTYFLKRSREVEPEYQLTGKWKWGQKRETASDGTVTNPVLPANFAPATPGYLMNIVQIPTGLVMTNVYGTVTTYVKVDGKANCYATRKVVKQDGTVLLDQEQETKTVTALGPDLLVTLINNKPVYIKRMKSATTPVVIPPIAIQTELKFTLVNSSFLGLNLIQRSGGQDSPVASLFPSSKKEHQLKPGVTLVAKDISGTEMDSIVIPQTAGTITFTAARKLIFTGTSGGTEPMPPSTPVVFDPTGSWYSSLPNQPEFNGDPNRAFAFRKTPQGLQVQMGKAIAAFESVPGELNTYAGKSFTVNGNTTTPAELLKMRLIVTGKDSMIQTFENQIFYLKRASQTEPRHDVSGTWKWGQLPGEGHKNGFTGDMLPANFNPASAGIAVTIVNTPAGFNMTDASGKVLKFERQQGKDNVYSQAIMVKYLISETEVGEKKVHLRPVVVLGPDTIVNANGEKLLLIKRTTNGSGGNPSQPGFPNLPQPPVINAPPGPPGPGEPSLPQPPSVVLPPPASGTIP